MQRFQLWQGMVFDNMPDNCGKWVTPYSSGEHALGGASPGNGLCGNL